MSSWAICWWRYPDQAAFARINLMRLPEADTRIIESLTLSDAPEQGGEITPRQVVVDHCPTCGRSDALLTIDEVVYCAACGYASDGRARLYLMICQRGRAPRRDSSAYDLADLSQAVIILPIVPGCLSPGRVILTTLGYSHIV